MKHNHDHCEHERLRYCKKCNVTYCDVCGEEWHQNSYTTTYGGTTGTWPAWNGTTLLCSHGGDTE